MMEEQSTPKVTPEDVRRIVRRDFADGLEGEVRAALDRYGASDRQGGRDRVHLAILKLAAGDLDALKRHTETASRDYRDVLALAEYPECFRQSWTAKVDLAGEREEERTRIIENDWNQYHEWLNRG